MRSNWMRAVLAACLSVAAGTVAAQTIDGPALRLEHAIEQALQKQPALAGFEFQLRERDAGVAEAAQRPQIEAEVQVEDAAGTGERRGFDSAQTTLSLSGLIELGGKRSGRIAVAEMSRARVLTARAARQLDVTAEVARRFVAVLLEQEQLAVGVEAVRLAERTHGAVAERVRIARSPEVEAARAEVRIGQARLDLEHAEHELASSRRWLAAAMGEREPTFGQVAGDLLAQEPLETFENLLARIGASVDFLVFADEERLLDARLRLAELKRRPDLRMQIGVRRFEEADDVAMVAGFSMPLDSARRAQPSIAAARAERARVATEREAAFLKVQAQLFEQYQELDHARVEMRTLRESVIPRLERVVEQAHYAYTRGRYSWLEWADAQRELLEVRRRLNDVAANFHTLRIEIERLTAQSLGRQGDL
jgi:cobalt-zinc-cadmium efflux system outer membrane protein